MGIRKFLLSPRGWEIFSLDPKGLVLFRVLLAAVLLADDWVRFPDIATFYGPDGLLAGVDPAVLRRGDLSWSLNTLVQGLQWQDLLFALHTLFAVLLLFGVLPTPLLTASLWVLTTSRHVANPYVNTSGDELLRHLLLWSSFIRLREIPYSARLLVEKVAMGAFIIQLVGMYFFSALLKEHPVWWGEGTAIRIALRLDSFVTPFGRALGDYPKLCSLLTTSTVVLELLCPLLVLWPLGRFFRSLTTVLFVLFHIALILCFQLGYFPFVCIAAWSALLPLSWWSKSVGGEKFREGNAQKALSWALTPLVCYLLLLMLALNVRMNFKEEQRAETGALKVAEFFQLWQFWAMFAPLPSLDDGYNLVVGELEDGTKVDLSAAGGRLERELILSHPFVEEVRPKAEWSNFASAPWKKFLFTLHSEEGSPLRAGYLRYLCHSWNQTEGARLKRVTFAYGLELTKLNGEESPLEILPMGQEDCVAPPSK